MNINSHPITTLNGQHIMSQKATATSSTEVPPTPQAMPRAKRRTFSAEYKRRILQEAEQCTRRGEIGSLLRREGLYSSHLTDWRRQAEAGQITGATRGRKPLQSTGDKEKAQLQRENNRLRKQLDQAEKIIEAQKKVADLMLYINQTQEGSR